MKNFCQKNLSKLFLLIACVAASKITWLGLYEVAKPNSLKNK